MRNNCVNWIEFSISIKFKLKFIIIFAYCYIYEVNFVCSRCPKTVNLVKFHLMKIHADRYNISIVKFQLKDN